MSSHVTCCCRRLWMQSWVTLASAGANAAATMTKLTSPRRLQLVHYPGLHLNCCWARSTPRKSISTRLASYSAS
ncbi:hypothetical protein PF007_g28080 [Phytophthora fragariae]|uniref:RxLR effector protein n=2 Tax=Phytophthora TaxID=4783 RepID=A0A6A3Q311_9STRA|nr:hypothetical protein PF009_g28684 [Phytophthora fragariae]KAE9002459.1 hypothetical protein PR002_g17620 [Phytophthora rubi]KAE9067416.1 hypothetical protein PF007_g28080 [Phytophthora fragariae]